MKIAVGSDHGGFALKEAVKKHLEAKGIEVEDFGCYSTESVDYAVYGAKVGHIGLYRDHDTLQPVEYYNKLPSDIEERDVIVLDPMLATGGSAMDAITIVKRSRPRSIKFLCIIAAPEGLKALSEAHPDVHIYCAAVDEKLNEHGYILPGLGDAGDRIFGTM